MIRTVGVIVMFVTCASLFAPYSRAQTTPSYTFFAASRPEFRVLQEGRITLVAKDMAIRDALYKIATQAGLALSWNQKTVPLDGKVSVELRDVSVQNALAAVLRGSGGDAKWSSDGQMIMIVAASSTHRANKQDPTGSVQGRVTDSTTGKGIEGVTVSLRGTKLSAMSNANGAFVLHDVPVGTYELDVKLLGYAPVVREVHVVANQSVTMRIVLKGAVTMLSGVVTTAAGLQRRVEVGNDITVLNADSIMRVAPALSVTDLLATRVPGLTVLTSSGIPGAPSRLRLRGQSSLLGSDDPIVIVDGIRIYADQSGSRAGSGDIGGGSSVKAAVSGNTYAGPSALDQIDPNSIETIEVFKGPSATAIYGSDAANGVIVITTKRGRSGPATWAATVNTQRTTLPGDWPINYFRFGHDNSGYLTGYGAPSQSGLCSLYSVSTLMFDPGECVQDSLVAYQAMNDARLSPMGTGWNQNGSLTVSGGSNALTYSVTGTTSHQTGYLHLPDAVAQLFDSTHGFSAPGWMKNPDVMTYYGITSNVGVALGQSGATLGLQTSLSQSNQQQGSLQGVLSSLSFAYFGTGAVAASAISHAFPNIYERAQNNTVTTNNGLTLNGWSPWPWLPVNATAGVSFRNTDGTVWQPAGYVLNASDSSGRYSLVRQTDVTKTLSAWTNLFNGRLISANVGLDINAQSQTSFSAQTTGLPVGVSVPTTFAYAAGQGPIQSQYNKVTYGWHLVPQIRLNDRLFVSPGFRLDGGSASGTNAQSTFFPKMDVSWIALDRQNTTPLFGMLSLLRPRIVFGIAGVQPGPTEQLRLSQLGTFTPLAANGPGVPVTTSSVYTVGNTQIHPERSRELEGGADIYLWGDALTLSLTAYDKLRTDAIQQVPVGPSALPLGSAAGSYYANVGDVRNRGIEVSVDSRLVDARALQWSMHGHFSHNSNILVRAATNNGFDPGIGAGNGRAVIDSRLIPGYPIDGLWAKPIVGYADANGDGIIAPNEVRVGDSLVFVGTSLPKYELSLSTNLSMLNNRVTFNTAVAYQQGMTQFLGGSTIGSCAGVGVGNGGCGVLWLNDPTLPASEFAAIVAQQQTLIGLAQTVSMLRWQSLSISYIVPTQIARHFRVAHLSLALQGSNLLLHTNYRGKDPNVSAVSSGNFTADSGQLPSPRLWSLGVRMGN